MRQTILCEKCNKFSFIDNFSKDRLPVTIECPECGTIKHIEDESTKVITSKPSISQDYKRWIELKEQTTIGEYKDSFVKFMEVMNKFKVSFNELEQMQLNYLSSVGSDVDDLMLVHRNLIEKSDMEIQNYFIKYPFYPIRISFNSKPTDSFVLIYPSYIKYNIGLIIKTSSNYKFSLVNGPTMIFTDMDEGVAESAGIKRPSNIRMKGRNIFISDEYWIEYFSDILAENESSSDDLKIFNALDLEGFITRLSSLGFQIFKKKPSRLTKKDFIKPKNIRKINHDEHRLSSISKNLDHSKFLVGYHNLSNFLLEDLNTLIISNRDLSLVYPSIKKEYTKECIVVHKDNYEMYDEDDISEIQLVLVEADNWDGFFFKELMSIEESATFIFLSNNILLDSLNINHSAPMVYSFVTKFITPEELTLDVLFELQPVVKA